MSQFFETIRNAGRAEKGEGAFLSAFPSPEDHALQLTKGVDKSGRQVWALTPIAADTYVVTCSGGRGGGFATLSCAQAGGLVDLWLNDDHSGRQHWRFDPLGGRQFAVSIAGGQGLDDPAARFLAADPQTGALVLQTEDRASPFQRWVCVDHAAPPPSRVYLGGAFQPAVQDLAGDPAGWPEVAARAGYWMHPMGLFDALNGGWLPELLSRFAVKSFVYEMDLQGWSDGSNPVQTATPSVWGDALRQSDPAFECQLYAPWVAGDKLADALDDTTAKYAQICARMDAAGYASKGYFFYAPPSPESIANADALLTAQRNGACYVEYVVRTAGLSGIALDFPAGLWLSPEFPVQYPPGSADKCRALAKQAHDVARRLGVGFAWVFNGSDDAATVQAALASIRAAGMVPDLVGIDDFSDPARRGTPESDPSTLSGQALGAIQWLDERGNAPRDAPAPAVKDDASPPGSGQ